MSKIERTIDLPADMELETEQYSGRAFRPAVLTERLWRGDHGYGAQEMYSVRIEGPRLKKNGGDHASAQGEQRFTDDVEGSDYTPSVDGTRYAPHLIGRAALRALIVTEDQA